MESAESDGIDEASIHAQEKTTRQHPDEMRMLLDHLYLFT